MRVARTEIVSVVDNKLKTQIINLFSFQIFSKGCFFVKKKTCDSKQTL